MNRREFLTTGLALTAAAALPSVMKAQSKPASQPAVPDDVVWQDVRDWGVEGRAFNDTESYFDRLPARARGVVRLEIWNLSHHTSGMSAHFQTDADAIYIRYQALNEQLAMAHMPATGVSGVDIYARDGNVWHWLATHAPRTGLILDALVRDIAPGKRAYHINLPLYNGVKSFEIGVRKGSAFAPTHPRKEKPILFYGTSITQGACASRPGMSFVNILGRRLDRPVLNFGYSGNGRMEFEVVRFLAEIDAGVFIIDCGANMSAGGIAWRTAPVVKMIRDAHAQAPIMLLDEHPGASGELTPAQAGQHRDKTAALRKAYEKLPPENAPNVHFLAGDNLIGLDGEGSVDGVHPNDLGMMRYADALEPELRRILKMS